MHLLELLTRICPPQRLIFPITCRFPFLNIRQLGWLATHVSTRERIVLNDQHMSCKVVEENFTRWQYKLLFIDNVLFTGDLFHVYFLCLAQGKE